MLLREYAIQPEVLTDLNAVRYFLDQTGVNHGRMISRYPKKWLAMVYTACAACRPAEKAKIEIRLKNIKPKLLATGRPYNGTGLCWSDNAVAENGRTPFAGVILADNNPAPRSNTVVSATDVDEACQCWQVSRDTIVNRAAVGLCRPAANLLRMSKEIVFVDQYFDGDGSHGKPLTAFLTEVMAGISPLRVEYHFAVRGSANHITDQIQRMIRFLPPLGKIPLHFVRWNNLPDQDGLHPRYILTELGGLKYDWGLAEDDGKTTDVHLLDTEIYTRRWAEYCAESTAFQFVDGFEILHGRLYSITLEHGKFRNTGPV